MTYRTVCLATCALYAAIALVLLLFPGLIYWLFDLTPDPLGDFLSKRAAMLFLALATICYLTRNASASEIRNAIALGIAFGMIGLALTGVYEFFRGYVGIGIWLAIVTEVVVAASFLSTRRRV